MRMRHRSRAEQRGLVDEDRAARRAIGVQVRGHVPRFDGDERGRPGQAAAGAGRRPPPRCSPVRQLPLLQSPRQASRTGWFERSSVMNATTRMTPWQRGQTSGSTSYTRRMSLGRSTGGWTARPAGLSGPAVLRDSWRGGTRRRSAGTKEHGHSSVRRGIFRARPSSCRRGTPGSSPSPDSADP